MRDYSVELTAIAAGIVADILGLRNPRVLSVNSGNDLLMAFDGYPAYNSKRRTSVYVQFPHSTFLLQGRERIRMQPLPQARVKFYQDSPGSAFIHPHVFSSGVPCWRGGEKERIPDFLSTIVQTFLLSNVSVQSITEGRCASAEMGIGMDALNEAAKHGRVVLKVLKVRPCVRNQVLLQQFISTQWSERVTKFMKSIRA